MLSQLSALVALLFSYHAASIITPPSIPTSPSSGGTSSSSGGTHPSSGGTQSAITEARHTRKVFYVGGQYNKTASGTVLQNQIYVEQLTPVGVVSHPEPLILLHGGDLSGDLWLNKPDGGRGWASFFLDLGYQVYIVDEWSVGRSGAEAASSRGAGGTLEGAEEAFTAPERYNKYFQARFHTQWPGNGSVGDPAFDDFYSKFGPITIGAEAETVMRSATCDLLKISGRAIFIAHSIGSEYALQATDACPDFVAAHVSLEGDQTPFASYDRGAQGANTTIPYRPYGLSNIPLTFDPPVTEPDQLIQQQVGTTSYTDGLLSNFSCILQAEPAKKLPNVAKTPILFLVSEASIHITYDHCQVSFLQQAGVNVTFTRLGDEGIRGNGHFMMLEKNSDQIASFVANWLSQTVTQ